MTRFSALRLGGIYVVCGLLQRVTPVLLLPLYLPAFSPGEYGALASTLAIATAASAVVSFGLETAILRHYFVLADSPDERRRLLSSVGLFLFVAPTIVVGLPVIVRAQLTGTSAAHDVLSIGLLGAALQTSVTIFPLAVARAAARPRVYIGITVQYSLVLASLVLLLVVARGAGPLGWVWSNALAWMSVLPYGVSVLHQHWTRRLSRRWLGVALAFGIPLVPHAIAHWGLGVSDRAILSLLVPSEQVGIYSLGYQAGAVLGIILTAVNWAFMPRYGQASTAPQQMASLAHVVTFQVLATGLLGLVLALFVPEGLRLVSPTRYQDAARIVPWVVFGYGCLGLYYIPMNLITLSAGHTRWVWVVTTIAAISNSLLNLLLVPKLGYQVAAINSAVSYAVLLTGILAYSALVHAWPPTFGRHSIAMLAVVIPIYWLAQQFTPSGVLTGILARAVWGTIAVGLAAAIAWRLRQRAFVTNGAYAE